MNKKPYILLLCVAVLGGLFYATKIVDGRSGESQKGRDELLDEHHQRQDAGKTQTNAPVALDALRSPSQRDTQVDGRLRENSQGQLIVERGVRDVFDYFMTASGELSLDQIVANIHRYIDANLSVTAAAQAKALLTQYVSLESSLNDYYESQTIHSNDLLGKDQLAHWRNVLDQRTALREEILGDAAKEFFGDEAVYDEFTIERMQLETQSLSPEHKQKQVETLIEQLPDNLKTVVRMQQTAQSLDQQTAAWSTMPESARYNARQQAYGTESAKRLATLDKQRAQWNQRIEDYLKQKSALSERMNPSSASHASALAALQQRLFTETERLRLPAYEP